MPFGMDGLESREDELPWDASLIKIGPCTTKIHASVVGQPAKLHMTSALKHILKNDWNAHPVEGTITGMRSASLVEIT